MTTNINRLSVLEQLNEIFDSLPPPSTPTSPSLNNSQNNNNNNNSPSPSPLSNPQRTAPLNQLPSLIKAFELKRNLTLLTPEELNQLETFAALEQEEVMVGPEDFMNILLAMGVSSSSPKKVNNDTERKVVEEEEQEEGGSEMELPDPSSELLDGSPSKKSKKYKPGPLYSSTSDSLGPSTSPNNSKRKNLLSSVSFSQTTREEGGREDLNDLVFKAGESYLRVALDGPLGEVFDGERIVQELKEGKSFDSMKILGSLTYPQIRAIDKLFKEKYNLSLLDFIRDDKSISSNDLYTLEGLTLGPLNWDVELLRQTLANETPNETLIIEILCSRSPSSLSLLRSAYANKVQQVQSASSSPSSSATSSGSNKFRSLDSTILELFKSQVKLRRAFEIILEGKWEDAEIDDQEVEGGAEEESKLKEMFLKEDVDQLKVALRKGGNLELVTRILLARSPSHLHSISVEYSKATNSTLTTSIKDVFSGMLQKILLHTVDNSEGANDVGAGISRDTKLLHKAFQLSEVDVEALSWRLVRLHWDRPKSLLVQLSYEQNYLSSLSAAVEAKTSGSFRDLLKIIVESASLSEPIATFQDEERLAALSTRLSTVDTIIEEGEETVEEAEKQRANKISGAINSRSSLPIPITKDTSMARSFSQPIPESKSGYFDMSVTRNTPGIKTPRSVSMDFSNLTPSSNSTGIPHPTLQVLNSASSLSFRQRSSPLENMTPKSDSKSSTPLSIRSRPIAPAKLRRTSDDHGLSKSGGSNHHAEPLSPNGSNGEASPGLTRGSFDQYASDQRRISGTLNNGNYSRSESMNSELSLSSSTSSIAALGGLSGRRNSSSSMGSVPNSPHSPPSSIDSTSYHARPISPLGDVGFSPLITNSSSFGSFDFTALPPPLEAFNSTQSQAPPSPTTYFSNSTQSSPEKSNNNNNSLAPFTYDMRRTPSNSSSESGGAAGIYSGEGVGMIGNVRPESIFGMKGFGNDTQALLVHVQELTKRLKEAEGRLQSSSSSYEQEHIELENRLDEARAELQIKRREDKELRGNEKQHLAQISSLESDIAKLTKNLEKSREQFEAMKRSYLDQCAESEKLRALVTEARMDNRAAEEAASHHESQVQQFERDRESLQASVNKLEEDLATARRAQDQLDDQKAENLLLSETIDRLRFDMEELRSSSRKSLIYDESGASTSHNRVDGSIGNLGNELARRLAQTEAEEAGSDVSDGEDEVDDITVTTHRIVKKRVARGSHSKPTINLVQEKTTIVSDADTQTDAIETSEMDIQTDLIAVSSELVTPSTGILKVVVKSDRELQRDLAKGLGIDLSRLDQFIQNDKIAFPGKPILIDSVASTGLTSRRAGRWTSRISARIPNPATAPAFLVNVFPNSAKPYVVQILDSTTSFILYSLVMYMSGVITGTMFVPSNHHHTMAPFHVLIGASDQAAWHQYNNLGAVWGEGLASSASGGSFGSSIRYWLTELVWGGVSVVRKFPV